MDIDVSDIIRDGYIAGERFMVVRRKQVINEFGERSSTSERIPAVGSIQPTGGNSLVREDAFQTETKSIKVITNCLLRMSSKTKTVAGELVYLPDYVLWRGDSYVVRSVNDYSQYGVGMVEAECSSVDFIDEAPADQVS